MKDIFVDLGKDSYNIIIDKGILNQVGTLISKTFSVQMIPGFFDAIKYRVAGDDVTLNDIENDKLRKGFEDPRIVVEVKHRPNSSMGSQEIRSFLGGRQQSDKGLYVSTGGFSKDAQYEAERANIPVTLMDLEHFST